MTLTRVADTVESSRADAEERQVHDVRTASILGVILGVSFLICFLTGMWSHLQQHPPGWLAIPIGPAWTVPRDPGTAHHHGAGIDPAAPGQALLRLTEVARPSTCAEPAARDGAPGLLPLVGASVFMLATGAANVARWYPFKFFFPVGHFWGRGCSSAPR